MSRLRRIVPVIVIVALIAGAALQFWASRALAAPPPQERPPIRLPKPIAAPTLPPLPIQATPGVRPGSTSRPLLPGLVQQGDDNTTRRVPVPPGLRIPTMSEILRPYGGLKAVIASGGKTRLRAGLRPMAANGATVVLTGDGFNFLDQDITLAYGADVWAECDNIPTTITRVIYYVIDPTGAANAHSSNVGGTNAGQCNRYAHFNLSTPFSGFGGGVSTDPAYSGVWAVAMYDNTGGSATQGQLIAISYIVQISSFNFNTFSDAAGLNPAVDFAPGSTVYVRASGLNPAHNYQMGFVYTSGIDPNSGVGLPCEFSIPAVAGQTGTCYGTGATPGVPVTSGNFNGSWPTAGTSPAGTYSVELYDVTAPDAIGQTQFSLESNTLAWTLTPYNSVLGNGINTANTFATDGFLDQSVTGLTYKVSGLPAAENGKAVQLVFSDPNNVALQPTVGTVLNPPVQATVAGGVATFTQQPFPFSIASQVAVGPTQTSFAPNVSTAQVSDVTSGAVLGSKSFSLLAYQSQFAWTSPSVTVLNAAPGGTVQQLTITNTAGSSFALWNGDGIKGIKIFPKGGDPETLTLPSGGPFLDSNGNSWTASLSGGVITAVPVSGTAFLANNATLSFNISVAVPAATCTTAACYLQTEILPYHGIAYSAANSVTNGLGVLALGVSPSTVVPMIGYAVTGETGTANIALRIPTFNQMMYVQGTMGSASTDTYEYTATINNSGSAGGSRLMDIDFVFPSSENFNLISPTLNGNVTVNGVAQTNWVLQTQSANPSLPGGNAFSVWCGSNANNACGVPNGQSAVIKIHLPIPLTSFAEQNISANANFDGGCQGGACTLTSYALYPNGTTHNTIAGPSNLNSTELGAYSLNSSFMQMAFAPSTIPSGHSTTTVLTFTNTATASDPNPDYVDQINLSFPNAGIVPSSITVPGPWVATKTTGAGVVPAKWTIALCASPTPSTPCTVTEPSAIAPGGTLGITLNYTGAGATVGTYAIGWAVTGANGGANTNSAASTVSITASNTSATSAITNIGGYTGGPVPAPTAVPAGTEPMLGTDADATYGSSYLYTITNNGSTTITGATITIPNQSISFSTGTDGVTYFAFGGASAPVVTLSGGATGTAGTCKSTLTSGFSSASGGGNGKITLSGCTDPPGGVMTVYFSLKTPYLIGSEFGFTSTVTAGATVATTPTYGTADTVLVVLDGRLNLILPPNGAVVANITPAALSGATPVTYPVDGSVVVNTGTSPTTINFGSISGSLPMRDIVDASVQSDANGSNKWLLYVSTDVNPTNGVSPQFSTKVDQPNSSSPAGFTVNTAALTAVPTTTPGLLLSTYQGTAYHFPIDSVMSFQINTGAPFAISSGVQNLLITYTLMPQ